MSVKQTEDMLTKLYELKDNRYLGVSVLEILSYPEAPIALHEKESFNGSVLKGFKQALSELHKLGDQSTAYELLWLTEKVSARRKILCKRFSTKSRISRYQCA